LFKLYQMKGCMNLYAFKLITFLKMAEERD